MSVVEAFELFANNIAQIDPSQVAQLKAPESMAARVSELLAKKNNDTITPEEQKELDKYLALDLIISLAKARAHRLLKAA